MPRVGFEPDIPLLRQLTLKYYFAIVCVSYPVNNILSVLMILAVNANDVRDT
jgi:hypothetical protein